MTVSSFSSKARLFLVVSVAFCSHQALAAQTRVPDAGTLLQQFQQITPPSAPVLTLSPEVEEVPTLPPKKKGAVIHVKDFEIDSHIFPPRELKALIKDAIGKDLTFAELQVLVRKISKYYRDHDYLARAVLPRQTIKDGVIQIVVLESTLGEVKIDADPNARADTDFAYDVVASRVDLGNFLRPNDLHEAVTRLNETPGFSAAAELQAGSNDRETDAVVKVVDTKFATASFQENNESSRSVGSFRTIAAATLDNVMGRGDQTSFLFVQSSGSTYGRLAMTAPLYASGLTLGVNASALTYNVDEDFSSIEQDGYAYTGGMTAVYALLREVDYSVNLKASYDYKRLENSVVDLNSSSKEIHVTNWGAASLFTDHILAGGSTSLNASVTAGGLNLRGNANSYSQDQASAKTNGLYGKLNVSASRLQKFNDKHQLLLSLKAQVAPQNLDSSEQMSLGGSEGVRAYPVNEAMGDQGVLGRIEFRHKMLDWLQLYDFYDVGWIQQHKNAWSGWNSGSEIPNDYWLQGVGIGVSISPFEHANINATLAHVLGTNAGQTNGKDSDGYADNLRFWFRASLSF